jgi:hypothetical protein
MKSAKSGPSLHGGHHFRRDPQEEARCRLEVARRPTRRHHPAAEEAAEASKLIAGYFIAEPTLKTLKHGEMLREDVIRDAIKSQTFTPKISKKDQDRMQEIADILQSQGSLKTRDGKPFDVNSITDLSWQNAQAVMRTAPIDFLFLPGRTLSGHCLPVLMSSQRRVTGSARNWPCCWPSSSSF